MSRQAEIANRLKEPCLRRDNFRCMTTGILDTAAGRENRDCLSHQGLQALQNCPIYFRFRLASWGARQSACLSTLFLYSYIKCWPPFFQDHEITQIWATLTKCFPGIIGLSPSDTNHPTNLMTLFSVTHKASGEFTLAFEPTSTSPFLCPPFPSFFSTYRYITYTKNFR